MRPGAAVPARGPGPVLVSGYAIGSLCSGYEGLGAGVAAALGGSPRLAWVSDNDPGASSILAHRFPGVPNLGDLRGIGWGKVDVADVLCAGFPCQPVSGAGKRKGVQDERWIWPEIAAGIGQLGTLPRLLVLENVDRLLTASHGYAMAQVICSLAALGYVGRYGLYAASEWAGAPHRRLRWFCLAWHVSATDATDPARLGLAADAERAGLQVGGVEHHGPQRPAAERSGSEQPGNAAGRGKLDLLKTPTAQLASNGGSQHPDKRRAGGHGPTLDDQVSWELLPTPAAGNSNDGESLESWEARRQRNLAKGINGNGQGTPLGIAAQRLAVEWGKYEPAVRRWERITGIPAPCPVEPGTKGNRRLAPPFPEWMMGLPPGWVTDVPGLTRSQQLRAIGNGVVPQQVATAVRDLLGPAVRDA